MGHTFCDTSAIHYSSLMSLLYFQFAEKFQEVKEAAKLARDKSQEKVETLSNHSQVIYISLQSEILNHYNTSAVQLFPLQLLWSFTETQKAALHRN